MLCSNRPGRETFVVPRVDGGAVRLRKCCYRVDDFALQLNPLCRLRVTRHRLEASGRALTSHSVFRSSLEVDRAVSNNAAQPSSQTVRSGWRLFERHDERLLNDVLRKSLVAEQRAGEALKEESW